MYPQTISPYMQNTMYNPYQQYQRSVPIEQNAISAPPAQPVNFLKGRPVTSMEEAKVAQIDFDGTLNIFTDIANKRIYTKQINLDGTSSFNVYCLTEIEPEPIQKDYITRDEFNNSVVTKEEYNKLLNQFNELLKVVEQNNKLNNNVAATASKF